DSATYRQAVNACAKGMFAKASEEQILIMFQYMFVDDPYDEAELVVYLSDEPTLSENLVEVARVRPPDPGQDGSIGSGRFALFSGTFPRGSLNFNRGTYIELELRGADARCWVDNWDPHVECAVICGNYYIDPFFPTGVDVYDYLVLLAEFGLVGPGAVGVGKGCLDIVTDGVINTDDLLAWDTLRKLHLCPSGEGASAWCDAASYRRMIDDASLAGQGLEGQSLGESAPLLIFGKFATEGTAETPGSYLYSVDVNGTCVGDACEPYPASIPGVLQNEGRLVTDCRGNIYHVSIDFGLVRQDTQEVVVGPQQNISYESSKVSVGLTGGTGLALSDAEFHPCDPNIVYVVPVQVTPPPGQGCPYQAAAKLQLTQTSYNVLKLYGKNPDPTWTLKTLCNDPNDFVYSPDVQHLREIEIDANGNNLFVLSAHWINSQNWILMFDEADANSPEARVWLCDGNDNAPNVIAPTAMVVSSFEEKLYIASCVCGPNDEPNDLTIGVWRFSIDKTGSEATGLTYDGHMDINCPQPDLCDANVCDSNWGFTAAITSITENPDDGTLYVTGFTAPKFDTNAPLPYNKLNNSIFTTPMLAVLTHDTNEHVNAIKIASCDPLRPLVLPFSIVWTGDIYGGADITGDLSVTAEDFAVFALHWLEFNCAASNHCDGADIDKSDSVDWADLAVLAQYWLEIKCPY
ncbi:MAG: dimerization/docking domain-containing protein, partial [Planctomycetota bacterium]